MLGWIKAALNFALPIAKTILGSDSKPTLTQLLPLAVANLLPAVEQAVKYNQLDTQTKLDAWLDTIDASTGTDATAVDWIKTLPQDQEELLFDHLKEAARIYGYHLIGVPGYRT